MPHFGTSRAIGFQIGILILLASLLGLGIKTSSNRQQTKPEPAKPTVPLSGAGMFKDYCAVCHGKDAKGDGPAAPALKHAPADLTTLAKRHGGKLPDSYVANVLRNGVKAPCTWRLRNAGVGPPLQLDGFGSSDHVCAY